MIGYQEATRIKCREIESTKEGGKEKHEGPIRRAIFQVSIISSLSTSDAKILPLRSNDIERTKDVVKSVALSRCKGSALELLRTRESMNLGHCPESRS